jgi:hypothetical protein
MNRLKKRSILYKSQMQVLISMVLKTGPDRPVQPGTGIQSGPVLLKNRKIKKIGQKPETAGSTIKTANRSGWTGFSPVPLIPKLHRYGSGTVRVEHGLGTGEEESSQNYIVFPEKIKTSPDIFLTVSLPPLSRVGYGSLSLDISLSLLSSLCRHSLKSSLYRPRTSTGTKLPALPMLAAPSYHSKLLWVLACFICFNFWLYLILIKFLEIWWRHGRKVRKR